MAGEEASVSIAIDLESNAAAVAKGDAEALRELRESISSSTAELGNMNKALRALKSGGAVSEATVAKLKGQISATKATIASNTAAFVKAGGSFKKEDGPTVASRGLAQLSARFAGLPGPIGRVIGSLGGLSKVLAVGLTLALAAALVAVAAAAAAAAVGLAGYALSAANARRNEELRLQGLSKYRNFWAEMAFGTARVADSSSFLQQQLDEVAASSALGRDRIAEMQAELYRAGLRSGNLQAALEGLAIAESTQGAEGAAQFKARAIGAALYGQSVKQVSDDIKARLGSIAKAQLLSLDVQSRKLRENIGKLFKDLKIEGLLKAISKVTELFSQTTASGRAMKVILESIFGPLGGAAERNGILVRRVFQGMIIGALEFGIAVQRLRIYLKRTFGDSEILKAIFTQENAVNAGRIAFFGLVGAVAAGAVLMTVLAAAIGTVAAALGAVGALIGYAIGALIDGGQRAVAWFQKASWKDVGMLIADGLAGGIIKGIPKVIAAMKDMAMQGLSAFKSAMRIMSPSAAARDLALNVPKGVAVAYRVGTPMVRGAARDMASATEQGMRAGYDRMGGEPNTAPAEAPRGGGRAAVSRTMTLNIEDGAIRIDGTGRNADAIARDVLAKVEELFVSTAREFAAGDA